MGRDIQLSRIAGAIALVTLVGGCAVFGGGRNGDVGTPGTTPEGSAADPTIATDEPNADGARPSGSMEERLLAGDYEGVLHLFAADSARHTDEAALYRAGLAAAIAGHAGHDPERATRLFRSLLELHPETERRPEVELVLQLISRERDLRTIIGRLDRELSQLKAIDLGQQPEESGP